MTTWIGWRTRRAALLCGLCALMNWAGPGALRAASALDVPVVLTQVPREAKPDETVPGNLGLVRRDWFDGARVVLLSSNGAVRVLSEGFHSACDPSLSFDAKRVVFAGKRERESRWRIYEVALDDPQSLHPVSPENQEARCPTYLSSLFTLDSPEPWFTIEYSAREATLNEAGQASAWSLYNIKLDGTELRRVTFNPNANFDPFQMWDGRVIFAAERYPSEPGGLAGRVSIFSLNMEGTDLELYGAGQGRRLQQMPCATEQGRIVFVESDEPAWDGAGQLASVQERRPHHSYQRLTRDAAHVYLYPSAWRGDLLLVSRRPADGRETSGVFIFDPASGRCEPVFTSPDSHAVQAKAVRPRRLPDGRSTTVKPEAQTGVFYGMDCYTADERMSGQLRPGMFKRVRVIEGVPQAAGGAGANGAEGLPAYLADASKARGPFVGRRVLGTAPIESDGSFNIEVPADVPFLLQGLDERGLALATCGWVWVKPKENRGCIGCHEDPELIPENNYVLALRRNSNRLTPPPAERRNPGFKDAIVPILRIRCATADCHASPATSFQLPLNADRPAEQDLRQAYSALLAPREGGGSLPSPVPQRGKYVDAGRARTSFLVWQLFGADTSRGWDREPNDPPTAGRKVRLMPPPGKGGPLTEDEIRTVVEWIDLGAPWEAVKTGEAHPTP